MHHICVADLMQMLSMALGCEGGYCCNGHLQFSVCLKTCDALSSAVPKKRTPVVAGQLMQLRAEVSKFMRFVVSDKDAEQLAACEVGPAIAAPLVNIDDCVHVWVPACLKTTMLEH